MSEQEQYQRIKEFAENMRDIGGLADNEFFDVLNCGYQVNIWRYMDSDGRELGWIATASKKKDINEDNYLSRPDKIIITGNGSTPRIFRSIKAIHGVLEKHGVWNYVVNCD